MGFGFGGEWAVGAILIGETVRARYRGRAVGTVQSGWAVGWGVAVGLYVLTQSLFPPETAWRLLFALGVLPALGVFWIRGTCPNPRCSSGPPIGAAIVRPSSGSSAPTCCAPRWCARCCAPAPKAATDRLGRRPALVVCAVAAFVIVLPMTLLNLPTPVFTVLALPLGFVASAYFSGLGALLTEQYPTELRGSGQGFCHNFGRGIGALFPLLVGLLADALSIGVAIAMFAGIAYLVMAFCALLLPETRGAELTGTVP
ncbi:sugar transport protein [Pseudonocardia hierapolitana]|uniref:Sugar transport protein n=2 Tax=Pseudonocardia hierapolitana TaxID=1128676 RepID=A0A561SSK5_9PSEU|nr:sugar transport protein [Pseudonocardia hierapolitana]